MPGGPESKTPFGNLPPSFVNKSGFFRYSTISCSSAFASSHPLTSSNVLRDCSLIAPASYSFGSNEDLPAGSPPTPGSEGRFPPASAPPGSNPAAPPPGDAAFAPAPPALPEEPEPALEDALAAPLDDVVVTLPACLCAAPIAALPITAVSAP